jgi:hypothetical protein
MRRRQLFVPRSRAAKAPERFPPDREPDRREVFCRLARPCPVSDARLPSGAGTEAEPDGSLSGMAVSFLGGRRFAQSEFGARRQTSCKSIVTVLLASQYTRRKPLMRKRFKPLSACRYDHQGRTNLAQDATSPLLRVATEKFALSGGLRTMIGTNLPSHGSAYQRNEA